MLTKKLLKMKRSQIYGKKMCQMVKGCSEELDKQTEMAGKRAEILQFMALARSRLFGLKSESDGVSKIFQDEHSDVLDLYKRAIDELELDSNQTARLKTARIHDSLAYFHREFADPNNPEDSLDLSIEHYEKSILIKRRFEDRARPSHFPFWTR